MIMIYYDMILFIYVYFFKLQKLKSLTAELKATSLASWRIHFSDLQRREINKSHIVFDNF